MVTVIGDHLSGKAGNVKDFDTCHGNVRDFTASQGSLGEKSYGGKAAINGFVSCIFAVLL